MIFDQVSDTQMQAARILTGATMAGFLGAPLFRQHAQRIRLAVATIYIVAVLVFVAYFLI